MNIKISPQRHDTRIAYSLSGEILTATVIAFVERTEQQEGGTLHIGEWLEQASDVFDLSELAPGDKAGGEAFITDLPISPINSAERGGNGQLYVTLVYTLNSGADEAACFPPVDYQAVGDGEIELPGNAGWPEAYERFEPEEVEQEADDGDAE